MPDKLTAFRMRQILAFGALLGGLGFGLSASAQMNPGPPPPPAPAAGAPVNPICPRLEAQLTTIERGGSSDPAKDDQIRRYQDAAARQQGELERIRAQAKRMGCDSSGFFSLFNGQSAECGPVNTQTPHLRPNSDPTTSTPAQSPSAAFKADRANRRRRALPRPEKNNCR